MPSRVHLVGGGVASQHGVVVHIVGVVRAAADVVSWHQHIVEVCLHEMCQTQSDGQSLRPRDLRI